MSSLVVVRTISSMIGGLATGTVRVAWSLLREAFVALRESLRMAQPLHIFRLYRTPVCHCSEE